MQHLLKNDSSVFFSKIEKKSTIFLLILICTNIIIKIIHISVPSYWFDEAAGIYKSQLSTIELLRNSFQWLNSPLYWVVLGKWINLFGVSELSTRGLSLLFNTLTIPILYRFAKKYLNIEAAVFAVLIFVFSDIHYSFSLEARSYTMLVFMVVLSFLAFMKLLKEPNTKNMLLYALVNTITLYIQFVPIVAFGAQFLFALIYYKTYKKGFIYQFIGQAIAVILFIAWFMFNEYLPNVAERSSWFGDPTLHKMCNIFLNFTGGKNLLLIYIIVAIALVIFYFSKKHYTNINSIKEEKQNITLLTFWGILPVLVIFITSFFVHRFTARYMLFATPGLYLLFGYIISKIKTKGLNKIGLLLSVVVVSAFSINYTPQKHENWRGPVEYIKRHKTNNDAIIFCADYNYMPFMYYYDKACFADRDGMKECLKKNNIFQTKNAGIFKSIDPSAYNHIYLVLSHYRVADPQGTLLKHCMENFRFVEKEQYKGVRVMVFDPAEKPLSDKMILDFEKKGQQEAYLLNPEFIYEYKNAHSGNYVSKVNDTIEYSAGLRIPQENLELENYSVLYIAAVVKYQSSKSSARLVCSLKKEGKKAIFWQGLFIEEQAKANKGWQKVEYQVNLPENTGKGNDLSVYLLNLKDTEIFIDDICLELF